MKVCKFGGSSLADTNQVEKVRSIVKSDPERRIVVVSAPGKSDKNDIKITDLLIECIRLVKKELPYRNVLKRIVDKYKKIADGFGVDELFVNSIEEDLNKRLTNNINERDYLDNIKAAGEDNSARLIAECFKKRGINAVYINPRDAGLILREENGYVSTLDESYLNLSKLNYIEETVVFPGFFGYSETGKVITFSRGGSDITGAILAAATNARMYENYTDVDYVFTVDPGIVDSPKPIHSITFSEMRELSYSGFGVLNDEALIPAEKANIPIHLLNTNNPDTMGTIISNTKSETAVVTGIACNTGFCSITMYKQLMNKEIGFLKKVMDIFYNEKISIEHVPTGIDSVSIIYKGESLDDCRLSRISSSLQQELMVDKIDVEKDIALIAIVGQNMNNHVGILAQICNTISQEGINIIVVCQGASQNNIIIGVKDEDYKKAIKALYKSLIDVT